MLSATRQDLGLLGRALQSRVVNVQLVPNHSGHCQTYSHGKPITVGVKHLVASTVVVIISTRTNAVIIANIGPDICLDSESIAVKENAAPRADVTETPRTNAFLPISDESIGLNERISIRGREKEEISISNIPVEIPPEFPSYVWIADSLMFNLQRKYKQKISLFPAEATRSYVIYSTFDGLVSCPQQVEIVIKRLKEMGLSNPIEASYTRSRIPDVTGGGRMGTVWIDTRFPHPKIYLEDVDITNGQANMARERDCVWMCYFQCKYLISISWRRWTCATQGPNHAATKGPGGVFRRA